jgi:Bacterial Ig-like domain (group 2)
VNDTQLELRIGGQVPIRVLGTYSDGSVVDLSKSSQTSFVSQSPGIATVSAGGSVTGVAPGSTTIVVRHQTHQAIVRVVVTGEAK